MKTHTNGVWLDCTVAQVVAHTTVLPFAQQPIMDMLETLRGGPTTLVFDIQS